MVRQNPNGAVIGSASASTVTIKDDDAPPKIGFSVVSSSFGEGAGEVTIQVSLSAASEKPVIIAFFIPTGKAGGTASGTSDYTFAPGTLTFAPGEKTKFITLTLTQDTVHEANETIVMKLRKPTNAKIGVSTHTVSIVDDDP